MVDLHANRPSDVAFLSLNLAMLGALGTHGARKCSTVSVESHHPLPLSTSTAVQPHREDE